MIVNVPNSQQMSKMWLTNILYAPEAALMLISIGQIDDAGYHTAFWKRHCVISTGPEGQGVIRRILKRTGLYSVTRVLKAEQSHMSVESITLEQLHCWIGHITYDTARNLVEKELVTRVKLTDTLKPEICKACVKVKAWCTEASLIGPRRLHFDPDTNPVNPTTTPMFVTNPDERCRRMLKDVARCQYSHSCYNHITAHMWWIW
jgi:hypothetical protein